MDHLLGIFNGNRVYVSDDDLYPFWITDTPKKKRRKKRKVRRAEKKEIIPKIEDIVKESSDRKKKRSLYKARRYRKENPICEICRIRKAEHTHHLIPLSEGSKDSYENFISVCIECHSRLHYRRYRKFILSSGSIKIDRGFLKGRDED